MCSNTGYYQTWIINIGGTPYILKGCAPLSAPLYQIVSNFKPTLNTQKVLIAQNLAHWHIVYEKTYETF